MLYLIIAILVFDFLIGRLLSILNARREKLPVPEEIVDIYSEEKHREQVSYAADNRQLSWLTNSLSLLLMLLLLCLGGFRQLDIWVHQWTEAINSPVFRDMVMAVLYFVILSVLETLLSLPLEIWSTFHIEAKYGFNKTTPRTFVLDQIKSLALSILLTTVLMSLIVVVYDYLPGWFWLIAWAAVSMVSLFVSYFYSQLIVPIYNKQTPLEQGQLREQIETFAKSVNFDISDIYVMDSSKRSTHANAYFTGWGIRKRIVLYDTLIEQLSNEQIVAVLSHEIGHYQRHHTLKRILSSLALNLLMFILLGLVLHYNLFAGAIGCVDSLHVDMFIFSIVYSPLNMLLSLIGNYFSRRHEYEADEFALRNGKGKDLVSALKVLSANSLSNPNPHPWFVFFHYSHPTLVERIRHLSS